jgi:arylsulfatase A-like enzyme
MLKFIRIVVLVGIVITSFAGCHNTEQMPIGKNPNIILIMVDDLGKEWVSCYGADSISTPNIDALAASGIIFNNVYCMPQCTPTRVSLLTGQYPFRHGWVNHWDVPRWGGGAHFDETINPSLGLMVKSAGYHTCIAGKWQIDDFRVEPKAMINNGFDEFCMWTGFETGVEASAYRYQEPYLFTREGSSTYHGQFGPNVFRKFIQSFIQKHQDDPFFIYYPMVLTHTPFVETPDEKAKTDIDRHRAMVRYTDKIVGQIVNTLDELLLRENTLVIFTTDNGTTGKVTGSRLGVPVKGGKSRTSEAGICVPFIASWPAQVPANSISDALIDFTDIYPTLMDVVGLNSQKRHLDHVIDGKSFYRVLTGKAISVRKWILSMGGGNNARLTEQGVENEYRFRDRVIRGERYKLYIDTDREPEKFYDLINDPFETNDLLKDNTIAREHLYSLMSVVDSFPEYDNDPRYNPNPSQPWDVEITAKSQLWKK